MGWADLPDYVTKELFMCTDVRFQKPREDTVDANVCLWKCWLDGKKKITNRDNPAVKQAGAQMTGKMVPSGCGMEVWYDMLRLHMWHAQLKEENVVDPGLGGSVAKAAGGGSDAENDDCGYDEDEDGGSFNGDGMRGHQLGGPRGVGTIFFEKKVD